MTLRIQMRRPAQAKFKEGYDWYEQQRPGLGDEFADEIGMMLDRIGHSPEMYACLHKDVRRAPVHRFPYGIYYQVKSDRVRVIAIVHSRRDPAVWQARV